MDLLSLVITVALVSASGALAPGPLFFVTLSHATKSGIKGGLAVSIGHTLVEFPLVVLLALGLLTVAEEPVVTFATAIAGGAVLLILGAMQIRSAISSKSDSSSRVEASSRNPLILGLVFTGLNPYFIFWWLTVGGELIRESLVLGSMAGVLLIFASHIWMDYAWLMAVAYLARKGTNIIGTRGHRILTVIFGLALIYFGIDFLRSLPPLPL